MKMVFLGVGRVPGLANDSGSVFQAGRHLHAFVTRIYYKFTPRLRDGTATIVTSVNQIRVILPFGLCIRSADQQCPNIL